MLFELIFGEGILALQSILLFMIQFPGLLIIFGVQIEPDKCKDGDKDKQSLIADDHIAHVLVFDGEILGGDEDGSEDESYDLADDEENILRFQEIRLHHDQNNDVGGLSPCYYLKAVAPSVEADCHQDHEDVVDQEDSDVFMAETLVLVVFGQPVEVHLGCYVHGSVEEYHEGEDQQQPGQVVLYLVVLLDRGQQGEGEDVEGVDCEDEGGRCHFVLHNNHLF